MASTSDPQHPDIAAPTLAQMPALIAKHDEFAALAAEHGHEEMAALHAVTAAALRFLTRPVEDEEVGPLLTRAKIELAWDDPAVRSAVRIPGKMTPDEKPLPKWLAGKMCDALARLARDKASAEQERDALRLGTEELSRQVGFHVGRELDERDRASRAEQEIARLRGELETIAEERDAGRHDGLPEACPAHDADTMFAIAERALAAAAGAEEPRSAVPGAPSPRWRQISPETEAGLKALDEATRLGPHRARKMPPTGEEEPR